MSCPICTNPFNDHVLDRRCFNICDTDGYAVCHECMLQMMASAAGRPLCPGCRGHFRTTPVFTRINNDDDPDVPKAPAPMRVDARHADKIVMLLDVSGSMNNQSGSLIGAPLRLELAGHMAKVIAAFCRKLGLQFVIHTFSDAVKRLDVDEATPIDRFNQALEAIDPDGQTFIGLALKRTIEAHGPAAKYFVFTDGEPSDDFVSSIDQYANTQLHLMAFGQDVSIDLLQKVGENPLHTISYIKDIQSLPGYMVPIFIWAVTQPARVVLSVRDEQLRAQFVTMLEPQVRGDMTQYKLFDLINLVARFNAAGVTNYSRDLAMDVSGTSAHSRIEYSFHKANWNNFGKFYLLCIAHCHKNLVPGNGFDPSLKHYRTAEYTRIFEQIADIPIGIPFVSFMTRSSVAARAAASASASSSVNASFRYVDSYPSSSSDDGCIGPNELVAVRTCGLYVPTPMKQVVPGDDVLVGSGSFTKIKWIIRISNLNTEGEPVQLINGLTRSHPIRANGRWIKAGAHPDRAVITTTMDRVYDVILEDPSIPSIKVNGIDAAVAGYPIPGMMHPYWGSRKVVEDVYLRYPDGGFVDVDATHFKHKNGLVSSLFP